MEQDQFDLTALAPLSAYAIFCGVIRTKKGCLSEISEIPGLIPWQSHLFNDNSINNEYSDPSFSRSLKCIEELDEYYYPGFVKCLFPGKGAETVSDPARSYTYPLNTRHSFENKSVIINYIDLFFFPEDHLIYCFKCTYQDLTLEEIGDLNNLIRNKKINELEFVHSVIKSLACDDCLNIGNKLKMFFCLSHDFTFSPGYDSDHLLFDLATCSPIGTSVGEGKKPELKPSAEYYSTLMRNHRISVFDNWTAMSLFDTFTLIHRGPAYNYNWEFRYFRMLYVHSLFIKTFLAEASKKFYLHKMNENLEEEFYQFDHHYNFKQISYNFLPQIIYEKIRQGLNVEQEMNDIRIAIEKDHQKRQERREIEEAANEKKINYVLFIIALLTVIEAVYHGSEWVHAMLANLYGPSLNAGSVLSLVLVYLIIYYMFKKKRLKKRG
jgi:hypothetical protein